MDYKVSLMGVRAVIENFSSLSTGILMSGYYIGYFVGSNLTPTLVSRVGHIRVFAAFASTASLSVLIIVNICRSYYLDIGKIFNRLKFSELLYCS